ncbi:effector-associated domain EAD1-containing protein [Nostoc sp. ChiQUE01b]|uniref:effector-associated domain EAD1-containing protein n=1 Tax=Nostoc sp. ChiQUE01b TaxID=3075376 RepID=UPI002AD46EFA|nr:effector-associated domain EAD1-containing protein [Nostoc sp. ChiQUE01b]MDZ8264376.1 effector-associated domain EAD1-containing protein [Nostoc sp. ChiQUE01b]
MFEDLTPDQLKDLRYALIAAFPERSQFKRMVKDELPDSLKSVNLDNDDYHIAVANLVDLAYSQGNIQMLLEGALTVNPGNPKLKDLVESWRRDESVKQLDKSVQELKELISKDYKNLESDINNVYFQLYSLLFPRSIKSEKPDCLDTLIKYLLVQQVDSEYLTIHYFVEYLLFQKLGVLEKLSEGLIIKLENWQDRCVEERSKLQEKIQQKLKQKEEKAYLEQQWDNLIEIIHDCDWKIIENCCYVILQQFGDDPKSNYISLSKGMNFDYLKEIFLEIQYEPNYQFNIKLMLQFANYLFQNTQIKINLDLENWINDTRRNLNIDENIWNEWKELKYKDCNQNNRIYQEKYPYLLITCEPCNSSENLNIFKLQSELIFQKDDHDSLTKYPYIFNEIDAEYNDICTSIHILINEVKKILKYNCNNCHELTIELFLPNQYLIKFAPEVEKIPQLSNEKEPPWFGYEYNLVIRSYDRFQDYSLYDKFSKKWDELHQLTEIDQKIVWLNKEKLNNGCNWKKIRVTAQKVISINMNVPLLNSEYNCHINEFLITVLRCGFPFSFWLRNGSLEDLKLNNDNTINQFENILKIDDFKNSSKLFKLVRDIRRDAYIEDETKQKEYLGYHLGFLFDNPHRLPSKFDSNKGSDILIFGL